MRHHDADLAPTVGDPGCQEGEPHRGLDEPGGENIDSLVGLFAFLAGPHQVVTAARMALYVEAGHDAALRAALARGRSVLEQRLRPTFEALGAPDPGLAVQALATTFEGMFLHTIAQHAAMDARRLIDLVVRAALGLPPRIS